LNGEVRQQSLGVSSKKAIVAKLESFATGFNEENQNQPTN
jgi:hypothetical protein